ncbi:LysR family transcriptional regulator [Anaerolentibacter hominis]|uniref:LysR family transcriptional regulator n=1 Tax=Anaerolentibacter hominis TaxID=3079009 RepID=UPI0031B86883
MNTIQLECFLAVARHLNFSRAAEEVQITQPAVSHQINSLEDELGTRLFNRTSKNVELTRAGMHFINDASEIMKIAAGARARLQDHSDHEPLLLAIGCHNQFELNLLPPFLMKLAENFPLLHPAIRLIPFQSLGNLLENETIHIMFGYQSGASRRASAYYHELINCPVSCVCAPSHPLSSRKSLMEDELTGSAILCEPHKGPEIIFQIQSRLSLKRLPHEILLADGYEGTVTLLKAGLGFTLLPDIVNAREEGLCYIPLSGAEPVSFGVYYKTTKGNPVLKQFVQLLKDGLTS